MCGIAGILVADNAYTEPQMLADLNAMTDAVAHRGPDDSGAWCAPQAGIGLGHRRLSIVDLSPLGHQPMSSGSGRYVISFNGEIYNYRQLAVELRELGHRFKGSSDTEVLLGAIEQWGMETALQRCIGQFALAVWDNVERCLHLARDRFGEKPLYYGEFGHVFGFASELKSLRAHSAFRADIDRDALALLLQQSRIPAPMSIYRQIRKLRAGYLATITRRNDVVKVHERPYWDVASFVASCLAAGPIESPADAVNAVEQTLTEAIGRQMVADVPVGAFLSGGVDSSLVVAIMQRQSSQPVRSFSIGFWDKEFNEAPYARAVAQHLGTQHTELIVTPQDALNVIPHLPQMYDEPFGDSSQIPTYLLAKLTRQDVTVSLSGDGGDELFGGYTRYAEGKALWQRLSRVPYAMRSPVATLIGALPLRSLELLTSPLLLAPNYRRRGDLADRLKERATRWGARTNDDAYLAHVAHFKTPAHIVVGASATAVRNALQRPMPAGLDGLQSMRYLDMCNYMTDDVLVKVDRAAMATSLETRVPLLDPAVAQVAWRIPSRLHWHDGRGKWPLRQVLDKYVPRPLIDRPKRGFGVPVASWLRADLKSWAGDLLDPNRIRREGYFEGSEIARRWQQHQAGGTDWSFHLWNVLMFQAWLNDSSSSAPR
jgi:asparagine synthase (glutamine-hydrolysing)